MWNRSKSIKWIIWLPFLVSLISFSGFAKSSTIEVSIPTELVDSNKANSSNPITINFCTPSVVQKEISKNILYFRESLNFAISSYLVKHKVQNHLYLSSINTYLRVVYLLKSDDSDSNFLA